MLSPLSLLVRLVLAAMLTLGVAYVCQRSLLQGLLPAIQWTVQSVQDDFVISSVKVATKGQSETVQLVAQLRQPLQVQGRWLYPQAWLGAPVSAQQVSGLQVDLTAGGTLSYSLLVFISVLAWPVSRIRVLVLRLLWAMPQAAALLWVNVATSFPAELWSLIHDALAPQAVWPLLVWSRMLMGGVGLVLAVSAGALALVLGSDNVRKPRLPE